RLAVCVLAVAAVVMWTGLVAAADTPPAGDKSADAKAFDQKVYKALGDVVRKGVVIFNRGEHAGCYYLYEGALTNLLPLVDQNKKWTDTISRSLADAQASPTMARRAFILREAIDAIREEIRPVALWKKLGGEAGVAKIVDKVLEMAAEDPKVNLTRGGKYPLTPAFAAKVKKQFIAFISQNTGGPIKYTGKSMVEAHTGMKITEEEFDAFVSDLRLALKLNDVSPESTTALVKIVEGTRKDTVEKPKKDK